MPETQDRHLKFAYFILGIALPLAGYFIWMRTDAQRGKAAKRRVDQAHDLTVEQSFPASDPPSAW